MENKKMQTKTHTNDELEFALPELSQAERNYLYNLAARNFQGGNFSKAQSVFQLLVALEPTNPLYLKSLAGCQQRLGDFFNAYLIYHYVYLMNMEQEPECLFYMANCLFEINEYDRSYTYITQFLATNPQEGLVSRAELLRDSLANKITPVEKSDSEQSCSE